MNRIKLHVRKGDNVEVISGNFKGSSGKVLEVVARKQHVLIEGVRIIKRQDSPGVAKEKSRPDRGRAFDQEASAQVTG